MYTFAFCWSSSCPVLSPLAASLTSVGLRIYVDQMSVLPAVADRLAGKAVVFTNLHPACAAPTSTLTLLNGLGTYKIEAAQSLRQIPAPGLDTLDVDVQAAKNCDNEWVMVAMVPVHDIGADVPAPPPAACPCWQRTYDGTCPGIKVPITLSIEGAVDTQLFPPSTTNTTIQQCIDPANFDIYTGRMAYSFCWRYACLPPVFASYPFRAVCKDLERWNIAKMEGEFLLQLQRTEGLEMFVEGKTKDPALAGMAVVNYTRNDDLTFISIPSGGVGNMTFTYVIPPGFDDLSAAVVMDSKPRPPPPPSPPGTRLTTCACPLTPPDTVGAPDAVTCNGTYATMTARIANASTAEERAAVAYQCVPWPNYDIFMRELAWSHCWRYDCLPPLFFGKPYSLIIDRVTKHNIADIPAAGYELITFPAPYGMTVNVVLYGADDGAAMEYNSTQGGLVVNGRLQVIQVPKLQSMSVQLNIPNIYGVDGMAAAVMLRYIEGSEMPLPPRPPSPPPAPPAPPPMPEGVPRVVITTDFMVTAKIPVETLLNGSSTITHSGYYVTVPIQFYTFEQMPDCSDASVAAYKQLVAGTLGLNDTSSITVSCRYATNTAGQAIARRLMAAATWLVESLGLRAPPGPLERVRRQLQTGTSGTAASGDAKLDVTLTYGAPKTVNPADSAVTNCGVMTSAWGASCDASRVRSATHVTIRSEKADTSQSAVASACSSAAAEGTAALLAASPTLSLNDLETMACRTVIATTSGTSSNGNGNGNGNSGGGAPLPPPPGAANPPAGGDASGMSPGAIAGIVIGSVAGVVIVGFVALAAKNKIQQSRSGIQFVDPNSGRPGAHRWRTYSMQQRAEEATRGSRPVAGVSVYT